MSVSNPYTSSDTLFVLGTGNTVLQTIAGPFSSGQIGSFNHIYSSENLEYDVNGFHKVVLVRIKSNILINPTSTVKKGFWDKPRH